MLVDKGGGGMGRNCSSIPFLAFQYWNMSKMIAVEAISFRSATLSPQGWELFHRGRESGLEGKLLRLGVKWMLKQRKDLAVSRNVATFALY